MSGGKRSKNIQTIALFVYLYITVVAALWLLGTVGEPFTFESLLFAIILIIPVLIVSVMWWVSRNAYSHEDPDVERLRKTLQVEKLQSEGIIAAIDDGVCIINQEGTVKHVNARFLDMVASSEDELLNRHYTYPMVINKRVRVVSSSLKTPHLSVNIARVFETGKPIIIEQERIEYVDGSKAYDLTISLLPLKNEDGIVSALMIVARDISSLIKVQHLKDEFIATASHELRTPATAISGYLDLMLKVEFGKLNDKQLHYVDEAKSSTGRMIGLINDMIDMSSLETGKYENRPVNVDMRAVVQRAIEDASRTHNDKYITPAIDVALPTIFVDQQRIQLIIGRLVDNAYKFTPDKGTVGVRVVADGATVAVEVTDNGMGVPVDKRELIFEKFIKLDDTGVSSGTGLGLSICKKVVDDWGGTISVADLEGGGVNFTFTIPNAVVAADSPSIQPAVV